MAREAQSTTKNTPRTLLLGINAPYNATENIDSYFDEFLSLAKTNQITHDTVLYMKLRSIDSTFFLTKGKLEELKAYCDEREIEEVIFSEALTSQQVRNLGNLLNCKVFDRTELILDIFEKSALTAEGKTQVAIAKLKHLKTRLAGKGVHLSQQSGVLGSRGPGETLKEKETRHIEKTILKLKKQLAKIEQARETQRKRRLNNRVPHICLIGYTNAGKSSILNVIAKGNVLAEDKLFATLDITTRELYINHEKKGIISDTVGFIQQLPHHLIEAFKSTLAELQYADLLLHVIDASDPNWKSHTHIVHNILRELNVDKQIVYVFNKADKLDDIETFKQTIAHYQPHVVISTQSKEGTQELRDYLASWQQ